MQDTVKKFTLMTMTCLLPAFAGAQTVTFRVDMSVQMAIGRYDPASDLLQVRGPFNGWGGTQLTLVNGSNSIYGAEIDIFEAEGSQLDYKFLIGSATSGDLWEGDVGPGDQGNRRFTYEAGGQLLETVFFDNLDTNPGEGVEVTFQVNMALLIQDGLFLPEFDWLEARGSFNNWSPGFELAPASEGSSIYMGTAMINSFAPGSAVEYKYIYNGGQWENGRNRTFVIAQGDSQALPIRYFNDVGPESNLSSDTEIMITVDMSSALTLDGTPFNPGTDSVYINGEFAGFTWWGWPFPPDRFELRDNGAAESGDLIAGDGIYSIRIDAVAGQSRKIEYKFSINGADNEAGFQDNHIRYIRETGRYALPADQFGDMVREPEILPASLESPTISSPLNGMVTLRWENRDAVLQHSPSLAPGSWKNVPGSQGANEMNFRVTERTRNYFRLAAP